MYPNAKIQTVRTQPSALKLMEGRERAPRQCDPTELPGGGKLGWFWSHCKRGSRCGRPPYDRLLTNPVLRADYRGIRRHECGSVAVRIKKNVDHLRAEPPALRWMRDHAHPPARRDQTVLDGGAKLGMFWSGCKSKKRCAKFPYDRLLTNPVLKADYRTTQ